MDPGGITFDDGAAYERFMGRWSRLAGEVFIRWLAPAPGLRWADIGCGNGAFTELLLSDAHAASVHGIDPSPGQLAFARTRLDASRVALQLGSATELPFETAAFDAAVMALVIFFVPQPEAGVAEMVRVTKPGGTVAAYAWDVPGGGFPTEPLSEELSRFGIKPLRPPRADVSAIPMLEALWAKAGLLNVRSNVIEVERTFSNLNDWWHSVRGAPSLGPALDKLGAQELMTLQNRMREKLPTDADGRIRCRAFANAVAGTKPA